MRTIARTPVLTLAVAAGLAAGLGVAHADAGAAQHTATYHLRTLKDAELGKYGFGEAQQVMQNGKVVGFDAVQGSYDPSTKTEHITAALELARGAIYVRFDAKGDNQTEHGRVVGGAGAYKGAVGTATVRFTSETTATLTLTYTR